MMYIGETKFTMEKRVQQHKKYVEYGRTGNSAIARHTEQFKHRIDWTNTERLETEKRLFPGKIIDSAYIKANRNRCMNLNEGLGVTTIYGKGKTLVEPVSVFSAI